MTQLIEDSVEIVVPELKTLLENTPVSEPVKRHPIPASSDYAFQASHVVRQLISLTSQHKSMRRCLSSLENAIAALPLAEVAASASGSATLQCLIKALVDRKMQTAVKRIAGVVVGDDTRQFEILINDRCASHLIECLVSSLPESEFQVRLVRGTPRHYVAQSVGCLEFVLTFLQRTSTQHVARRICEPCRSAGIGVHERRGSGDDVRSRTSRCGP